MTEKLRMRENELLDFWRMVVDPDGIGMPEAIANDIVWFTGEPIDVVLQQMARGKHEFKELWYEARVNVADAGNIAAFYRNQFVEAYELANWHCGRENGAPPLNYARAAFIARRERSIRALDFGSGIGTGSLCLATEGCQVDCADIATGLLQFVGHRLSRRGLAVRLIDLSAGEKPRTAYYDLVTCFDVLEHVPDQLRTLRELRSYLRPGGCLLVNLLQDSTDPDRPMHVSSAGDRLALVRASGLQPEWSYYDGEMQALRRTRTAAVRNHVGTWVDWLQLRRTV